MLAACLGVASIGSAQASPANPTVVNGQVTFSQNGNVFTITNSPSAIINWASFSINAGEMVRFLQQNSSSSVLNRITGQDPSRIMGALESNGRVFLINPNGIMFGAGSQVNVAGLVASTLAISNSDFLAGKNKFTAGDVAGAVSNLGAITTPSGGQVYLIAPDVSNSGIITSPQGDVVLAAGRSVQLADSSNPDMQVVVSAPTDRALNLGEIIAQGGKIGIYGALINQRGKLNANSAVVGENGKIILKASGTTLLEAGSTTTATGAGTGGEVQVLGEKVGLMGDALVDVSGQTGGGTALIGGDYQGKNAAVMNAQQTFVGVDAIVKADAIERGDGGKVVVWADGATSMVGHLSARGGTAGGNGGIAEASGKQFLDFRGTADLRAPLGKKGTLLLDPDNISIATGSDTYISQMGGVPFLFEANNTPAVLTPLTITNQLALSDVNIYTGTGSITVLNPVNWSNSSELTLSAATGIAVNAQVTNTGGGKLSLYTSGGNITQTAAISVPTLVAIADSGGVFLTHNGNTVGTLAGSGAIGFSFHDSDALTIGTVSGGAIPTQSGITSSSGDIEISTGVGNVSGGLSIEAEISTPSGILNLRNYKGDISQSAAINALRALIIADEGVITLNNIANSVGTLAGYSNAPGGFSFVNSGAFTVGTVAGSSGVLSFGAAPVSLTALSGNLTVDDTTYGVAAGVGGSGSSVLTLTASSGQVLGSGIVKGGGVTINAADGINLTGTQNEIGSLTANVTNGDVTVVNNKALSIASISASAANAAVDISTTAGSAFGIEIAGAINTGASGSVSLNAGASGAITRTGASSIISTNNLVLQKNSSGAIGTSSMSLLTSAVSGGNTNLQVGASGAGPQGLYLNHTGQMTLNSASNYGNNAAVNIDATNNLAIAGNLNAGSGALTLNTDGNLSSDNNSVITGGNVNLSATQNIDIGTVVSSTGNINMTAQQALTARGVSTSALNAGNVTLTANGGDMILGAGGALDARSNAAGTHGTVTLTSAGAIQMLNGNIIKAGALDMKAATGIYGSSTASPLAIMADSVQAQNTSAGAIRLSNSGTNLSVGGTSNYGIQQQGTGDVFLGNGSGHTTTIDKAVTTVGGNVAIDGMGGLMLLSDVRTSGGNVALTVAGNATSELAIFQPINAGSGNVVLTSSGAVYGGTGTNDITAGTLSVTANGTSTRGGGIGAIDGSGGLHTTVSRIVALTAPAAGIRVKSLSDLVVGPVTATAGDVVTTTGNVALTTVSGHTLTINGDVAATGNIDLTAGSAGSTNILDKINFAQNVTSSGGNIRVNANAVTGTHVPTGSNVASNLYVAPMQGSMPSQLQPSGALAQAFNTITNVINSATMNLGDTTPSIAATPSTPDDSKEKDDQKEGVF
ncbi:MAG: filamentous hemagglutinin N-terminal domain-containing protein [Pseudomonadota bacterium]